jgi:hypothetical protein
MDLDALAYMLTRTRSMVLSQSFQSRSEQHKQELPARVLHNSKRCGLAALRGFANLVASHHPQQKLPEVCEQPRFPCLFSCLLLTPFPR